MGYCIVQNIAYVMRYGAILKLDTFEAGRIDSTAQNLLTTFKVHVGKIQSCLREPKKESEPWNSIIHFGIFGRGPKKESELRGDQRKKERK